MTEIAVHILLFLSTWLGVQSLPEDHGHWTIDRSWEVLENGFVQLSARSNTIVQACEQSPQGVIEFPAVIHGAHEIKLDGKIIERFGSQDFKETRSFYGAPLVACKDIVGGVEMTWTVTSYTQYFARVASMPALSRTPMQGNFFRETLNVVAAGSLVVMTVLMMIIFAGKVSKELQLSLVAASLFMSAYFMFATPSFFGISISMLLSHKIADTCVWIGLTFFLNTLRLEKLINNSVFAVYLISTIAAYGFILGGDSGDVVQLGTTISFAPVLFGAGFAIFRLLKDYKNLYIKTASILHLLSLGSFVAAGFNDIFIITGLIDGYVLLSIGMVAGFLFQGLAVNEKIVDAYRERDFLRSNLEAEVSRKTSELKQALHELKTTQGELIQSAKLASLGTLAAGIAHEINNSLNYVNGSLKPLERMIARQEVFPEKDKALNLTKIMAEGLNLTFQIIQSLRSYTGLNQAKQKEVRIEQIVQSVSVMLKSKIPESVHILAHIPPDLEVLSDSVALHQIFMNLITNAFDAMVPKGGNLYIDARRDGEMAVIIFRDEGCGMSEEVRSRVFDPFFTTKEPGKGTGLGLHIVRREVERLGGRIELKSVKDVGTTISISIPIKSIAEPENSNNSQALEHSRRVA